MVESIQGSATVAEDLNAALTSSSLSEIALTGATGFIGAIILKQLVAAGWQVRALYRAKKGRVPAQLPGVQWIEGGLTDKAALNTLVRGTFAVIHCAGAVRGATQADFDRVNLEGARCIAEVAAAQAQIPKFLLISSLAAREPHLSHYAGSKYRGELAVKAASDLMRWTIIRPPAVYGPGDKELLPLFQGIAKGFAPLPGGGRGRFSMIYADDLAAAIVAWVSADAGYGATFELDDGREGGYDWADVLSIGSTVLRAGAKVRRIAIPVLVLQLFAAFNLRFSKIFRYAPMLTPGKVNELTHLNWVSNPHGFTQMIDWQPAYRLERGLAGIFNTK